MAPPKKSVGIIPTQITGIDLAKIFHELYEELAPRFGYSTRTETREFDENSPNGKLMEAVCCEIINRINFPDGVCSHNIPIENECMQCHQESLNEKR